MPGQKYVFMRRPNDVWSKAQLFFITNLLFVIWLSTSWFLKATGFLEKGIGKKNLNPVEFLPTHRFISNCFIFSLSIIIVRSVSFI